VAVSHRGTRSQDNSGQDKQRQNLSDDLGNGNSSWSYIGESGSWKIGELRRAMNTERYSKIIKKIEDQCSIIRESGR